ncbi:unnamed protein product [Adineta ricciae]|uniref:Ubiquitin-like domain-containing protein n=1 Tax=Adineta ricciae TaxID=249248 RepID=A0A814UYH1_ADIRI|nr:unnamed protein product [Adineta ricciae]CAF1180161.1 unnamed protein product [Adineta ricciae]
MWTNSTENDGDELLAAALSSILGKEIVPESSVLKQTQRHVSKISLLNQHVASLVYGKVGRDDSSTNKLLLTVYVTVLATKQKFSCVIERDASVDKLKQWIFQKTNITCDKQNLIHCGEEMDEGHLLSEYNVQDSSEISVIRLRAMNANDILILDSSTRDSHYDYDFTNIDDTGKSFTRANVQYRRPCGWRRFAIRVCGKYENEIWLGCDNRNGEWPVSYHGTKHDAAISIAQSGFDLSKHKRFLYGRGVYTTPNIDIAETFATHFTRNGRKFCVVIQNRINPETVVKLSADQDGVDDYWISPSADDVRPYGYCIKSIS